MRTRAALTQAWAALTARRAEPPAGMAPGGRPFHLGGLAAARADALEALAEYTRLRAERACLGDE